MAFVSQTHASFAQADLNVVKEERFVFETEWFDSQASLIRKYLLTYYPKDQTLEMVSAPHPPSNLSANFSTTSKTEGCSSREWLVPE